MHASVSLSLLLAVICSLQILPLSAKVKLKHIKNVDDVKQLKKLLRTNTNVLAIYSKSDKAAVSYLKWIEDVAYDMRGKATFLFINCGENKEKKKLCKKYNVSPSPVVLKHYKQGSFNKDYDRKHTPKSLKNFMLDPTGDIPWDEDATAKDVTHLFEDKDLIKLRRKERGPLLVMFYAPWCGYCKRLKPEYAAAATALKGQAVLAGMDVDKPLAMNVRYEFNITGFPTIVYFEDGNEKYRYAGKYDKQGIIDWMKDPKPAEEAPKEEEWKDTPSDVVHLTDDDFDAAIQKHASVLVMFYAPWCGHCKAMKPEFTEAAKTLKEDNVDGILAAVDCTKHTVVAKKFGITGYPTVKYFSEGEFKFAVNERKADKIVEFMKDPKEPPPPPPADRPWAETSGDAILHLNKDDFKETLKKKKHSLVMFYAPWCGHCKKAKPEIEKAAAHYKDDRKIAFAGIDCTEEQDLCQTFGVEGYPTFRYFKYGKSDFKYEGGRQADDFIEFMKDPKEGPPPPPPEPEWKDTPSAVHHLTDDTFDDFMATHGSVLVMFYAPWCGHCKAMKPDFIAAAETLKEKNENGVLAAVDCTKERSLVETYKIRGFPTLKYFKDGKEGAEYKSGRNKAALLSFMLNPSAEAPPKPKEVRWEDTNTDVAFLKKDTFEDFVTKHNSVLVMFYAPWCGHCNRMKPEYEQAAKLINTENKVEGMLAAVDCTAETELAEKYEIRGYPTIKYFKDGKEQFKYKSSRTADALVEFMKAPSAEAPPKPKEVKWEDTNTDVAFLKKDTFEDFVTKHNSVLVMFYAPWCGHCQRMKPEFEKAAKWINTENQVEGMLAAVDCIVETELAEKYEIKGYPTIKYFKNGQDQYKYKFSRTADDLLKFMKAPRAPPPKRAPLKEWSSDPSNVTFLTTATFEDFMKDKAHALVLFYAPWCGHCSSMKPAYFEAASILKEQEPEAVLAAVDCTKERDLFNKYNIKGYPTVKYFSNGEPVQDFDEERTTSKIVEFMMKGDKTPSRYADVDKVKWSELPSSVVHLTPETFEEKLKQFPHSLVMYHISWCEQCLPMRTDFMRAASRLQAKSIYGFAAVDCTDHGVLCHREGVSEFPTIKYYESGKYDSDVVGQKTVDKFVDYLRTKANEGKDEL